MKLLNVEVVLSRKEDVQQAESEDGILKEKEMIGLMKMEEQKREEVRNRNGYQKIIKSCEQAKEDGYEWLWIDTCCIDKRSSAELNDVDESVFPTERDRSKFGQSNGWPEWFMRGWTLQELIAPKQVEFFNRDWVYIGNKQRLAPTLKDITRIPCDVLTNGLVGKRLSVAQIMSWAARRVTTREEDRAYSLMGLFDVKMPMLYGEGKNAFQRLQLEIIRISSDHSIFAWNPRMPRTGSVLAEDPSDFWGCGRIRKVEPDDFGGKLVKYIEWKKLGNPWYIRRNFRRISTNPIHLCRLAWLRWRARSLSQQLRTFTVSNAGIQVCLPVIPLPDSPSHFRAILACTYGGGGGLATVDLVSSGSGFDRIHIDSTFTTYPEFKTLHLTHHQDVNEKRREFTLDDKHASHHGFIRCGTYPRELRGNAVALLSLTDGLVVIVYANKDARSRFAVGLGYHRGQGWVHVVYDERFPAQEADGTDFGGRAYYQMWQARAKHARSMPKQEHDTYVHRDDHFTKDAHLPRSIWAARVVWGRWEMDNSKVMVDVEQCPGCCDGPYRWTTTDVGTFSPHMRATLAMCYLRTIAAT